MNPLELQLSVSSDQIPDRGWTDVQFSLELRNISTKPVDVSRYRTQVERGMPVRRPGVVIIRTVTLLLPLDSPPFSVRYIHTPI